MRLIPRDIPPRAQWALEQGGLHPLLAQLYAARGVHSAAELDESLAHLLPPASLKGAQQAATLLADAIATDKHICIVADYDCDGATACAVAVRGLRLLGAQQVGYLVPDRVADGYGLTPPIARRVHASGAHLLVTVDNGIASTEGVAAARALGLQVLVTDHHLPAAAAALPAADAIVNPNQPDCGFASKALAGVGVMFYVLLVLRAELRQRGQFGADRPEPRLDALLPLVALGTVADVVRLDANNRRLVAQGLKRIRAAAMPPGLTALFAVARRDWHRASAFDLGFALGPRINAAGRLADMTLGIECLLTDDASRAATLAQQLDAINRERRELESGMRAQAFLHVEKYLTASDTPPAHSADADQPATDGNNAPAATATVQANAAPPAAISVFDADFHEGVVGIVAARLKDHLHRPVFVFAASAAPEQHEVLKGSGRSIAGFHLRDALDLVAKRHPGVLIRFGGHAAAAGCTIARAHFTVFAQALAQVATEWLDADTLQRRLHTDGALPAASRRIDVAALLQQTVWGQGFAAPVFSEELEVVQQRLVGDKHLRLQLRHQGELVDGIWFNRTEPLPPRAHLAYRLDINEWQGRQSLQLVVEGMAE